MKYTTFLPAIFRCTFDEKKLRALLYKLWLDAANNMSAWHTIDYNSTWTFGFLVPGNIVFDYMYVLNKKRKPTRKEVEEVIKALPYAYKYDMDEDDTDTNKVNVILKQ